MDSIFPPQADTDWGVPIFLLAGSQCGSEAGLIPSDLVAPFLDPLPQGLLDDLLLAPGLLPGDPALHGGSPKSIEEGRVEPHRQSLQSLSVPKSLSERTSGEISDDGTAEADACGRRR